LQPQNDLPAADINAPARASLSKRTAIVMQQGHATGKRNKQQAVTDTISAEIAHRQQEWKQACATAKLLEDSDSDLETSQ
jgi:hypothetical protein